MKKFWQENKGIVIFATVMFVIISTLVGVAINQSVKHQEWLDNLSPEELAAYEAEQEAERQSNIHEYELISVSQYVKNVTNGFGGVVRTEVCYTFCYLDNGVLKQVDDFSHLEYGLTKLIIGDKDMYIIDTNGADDYRYLQLTEETLKNIKTLANG